MAVAPEEVITHHRNPLTTAPTKTLPKIWISIHASCFPRLVDRAARGHANPMAEECMVPEGGVLQDQPSARVADAAPALALAYMATHPSGSVQIALISQVLLMEY